MLGMANVGVNSNSNVAKNRGTLWRKREGLFFRKMFTADVSRKVESRGEVRRSQETSLVVLSSL